MSLCSDRLGRVKPSPTVAVTTRALELRAAGRDVIGLAAGEPDFATPPNVRRAAKDAIDAGHTRYTAVDGIPELKAAIVSKFARENRLDYAPSEITVANGGKQVLWNALVATLDPGDEVVVPAPYWTSYPDMVRLAGGEPVIVATRPEDGFRITPAGLAAAISPGTRWLILNSPANPTGAAYDRYELAGLAEVLLRHEHVWVLSDDIYEHIVHDGFRFATLAEVEPRLRPRTLTMNGVSKAYAMTGWRIGYGGGPEPLIRAIRTVQSQTTSNPCSISQWAAVEALSGPQEFVAEARDAFTRRRDLVLAALGGIEGMVCPRPRGAFYVYVGIDAFIGRASRGGARIGDDEAFATALLDEAGVAVVFGAAFGMSPAIRISYAAADDVLRAACERIADFCDGLR
jgi:aspartate aminotransferase